MMYFQSSRAYILGDLLYKVTKILARVGFALPGLINPAKSG